MAVVAGLMLCFAWYFTILAGFYVLYCPVMYLMFINHKLYRKLVDVLFGLWELYPVALFQCFCNTYLHHFGDYVNSNEKTIIMMNHRTRIDWNYVWIALYHATQNSYDSGQCICKRKTSEADDYGQPNSSFLDTIVGGKSKIKFVLKDEIKAVPGLGWIMQLNFFLYVKRNWQEDQLNLSQFVEYYKKLNYDYRLVLFPEGTDLSEDNKKRSDKFADAKNLQRYEFVLHPRTTGWAVLCSRLRSCGLESIYDVTVAYDKPAQTEADLLRGKIPGHVYFYFKRYQLDQIPSEEDQLRTWLNEQWRLKETSLKKFHMDGSFIDPATNKSPAERRPRSLDAAMIGFIFWTFIDIIFVYALFCSIIFQFWVIYHTLLFAFVTWHFGGFHNIQYKLL